MERTSSRLPAPTVRANGLPAVKRGSGGGGGGGGGGGSVPFGYRRPATTSPVTAARRRVSPPPPPLALDELQPTTAGPPPPTAKFLKRGTGRTIATLGNPAAAMTPPPPSVRRRSGSPRAATMRSNANTNNINSNANVNGNVNANANTNATPLRSRYGSRDTAELLAQENPMAIVASHDATTAANQYGQQHHSQYHQQPTPLSPEPYGRQRKRSADMMDPHDLTFGSPSSTPAAQQPLAQAQPDEVDEPPLPPPHSGFNYGADDQVMAPMTPPPRRSSAQDDTQLLPVSPPESKRQKRQTRSPKTPLGISNYETEEGRLSATQRVRLSLSGYMTVASLSAAMSGRRESGASALPSDLHHSNGGPQEPMVSDTVATSRANALRPSSATLYQSTASLARSRFAASRSTSGGPSHIASALLPSKNAVDCLMGYIRELQRSEATLRVQLESIRKQRHDELARSTVRVQALETTIHTVESERDRERRRLEAQQHMIDTLKAEVVALHDAMMHPQPHNGGMDTDGTADDNSIAEGRLDMGDRGHQENQYPENPGSWVVEQPNDGAQGYEVYAAEEVMNGSLPASSYVTPPPSGADEQEYERTQQPLSDADGSNNEKFMNDQSAYAPSEGHYSEYHQPSTMQPAEGEWPDQNTGYYGQEYDQYFQHEPAMVQDSTTHPSQWAEQQTTHHDEQDHPTDYQEYALPAPPAAPMSPVAKLDPSRSPQNSTGMQLPTYAPLPMFRVAPRLSDIISPLSRSVIAAPLTTDHNVLTSVISPALSNPRQPAQPARRGHVAESSADHAFMTTPPSHGPPAFSMSGFHASAAPDAKPLPPSKPPTHQNGIHSNPYAHPSVPDHTPIEEEQFVPAEQVFKPFHTPTKTPTKTPTRKASTGAPKPASPMPKETLKELLIAFFTNVDKSRLRMADGYAKRYQGQEAKLFVELTKKYGAKKVAELKQKFENPLAGNMALPEESGATTVAVPTPLMEVAPSPAHVQTPTALADSEPAPPASSLSSADHEVVGTDAEEKRCHMISEPSVLMPPPSPDIDMVVNNAVSLDPPIEVSPAPQNVPSPMGPRRGPPLPFACDDAEAIASDMLPPPHVSVVAPPPPMPTTSTMAPPSFAGTAPSSPPRLAPSPPCAPPPLPSQRSPPRTAAVLRQRVSSQRPGPPGTVSSQKPNGLPVTLESLLLEFYRKHQPDKLKNVHEVVRQYTGTERELIALLKAKYGALSIKRLEQNLEVLEQQSKAAAVMTRSMALTSEGTKEEAKKKNKTTTKSRGCFGRVVFFVLKLLLIRVVVTGVLLGGLVALDHTQCRQDQVGEASDELPRGSNECQTLARDVESFEMSSLMDYVQHVEARDCFCDQWQQREALLVNEPSVMHVVELVKLVPFSRTIAEPAWLQFVDSYLPNLPYSEYYRSYAKPVFFQGKEYVVIGAGHAKAAYTTAYSAVETNLPEMPWREVYELHGKPLRDHALRVYHDVSIQVMVVPWGEYYDSYGKPAMEVTSEYASVAFQFVVGACNTVVVLVTDQWALLVEMYNEESSAATAPSTEDSTLVASSLDVLNKAAKASKGLAASKDTNEKGAVITPTAAEEASVSYETATEDPIETAMEVSSLTDMPVEIVVEQTGLDLSYTETATAADSSDEDEAIANSVDEAVQTVEADEAMDAVPNEDGGVVEETPVTVEEGQIDVEVAQDGEPEAAEETASTVQKPSEETDAVESVVINDHDDTIHEAFEEAVKLPAGDESIVVVDTVIQEEHSEHRIIDEDLSIVEQTPPSEDARDPVLEEQHVEDQPSVEIDAAIQEEHSEHRIIDEDLSIVEQTPPSEDARVPVLEEQHVEDQLSVEIDAAIQEEHSAHHLINGDVLSEQAPTSDDEQVAAVVLEEEETRSPGLPSTESVGDTVDVETSVIVETEPLAAEEPVDPEPTADDEESNVAPVVDTEEIAVVDETTENLVSGTVDTEVVEIDAAEADVISSPEHGSDDLPAVDEGETENAHMTAALFDENQDLVEPMEEDLSFLDDTDGFDPLELLDLADLAAAQLHTIN